MRGLRVTFLWVTVLVVGAAEKGSERPPPVHSRDDEPVLKEVRGFRNAGMKLNDQQDFPGAIEELRRAISLLHTRVFGEARASITDPAIISQDAALYAQILSDYGSVLLRAKQYEEAIEVLEDSVAMVQKIYGESHPSLGLSLRSLADAYMAQKAYPLAIKRYRTLRKHVKKGLGVTHEAYIEASLKIAEGYKHLNKHDKRLKVLKDAVEAQGETVNGLTTGMAELYIELSTAQVAMGDIPAARRAAEAASAMVLQRDGEETLAYAFSLNALAGVKMREKEVDGAIELLERAHEIAVKLFGDKDPMTVASAKTLRDVKDHKRTLAAEKDEL